MPKLNEKEIIDKLKKIFQFALNTKIRNFDKLYLGETKNWDSLKHIQVILDIEKEFKISFKSTDISKLNNFLDIKRYILNCK